MLLDLRAERAFLIRYPLDRIPAGQRITRAEWIVPVDLISATGREPSCTSGESSALGEPASVTITARNVPSRSPGLSRARRASRPTGPRSRRPSSPCPGPGELTINVTEDVELWYTGAAENQGWIVTVEDPAALVRLNSPLWVGQGAIQAADHL